MTLLQDALKDARTRKMTGLNPEIIELALAWLRGEVGHSQARKSLKLSNSCSTYIMLARSLREAYNQGKITIYTTEPKGRSK
jgi:hypothetical protein